MMRINGKGLLVAMTFSLDFAQNIDAVIIAQSARHLVIIHGRVILLNAPKTGQSGRVGNLKNTRFSIFPRDIVRIALRWIIEQLLKKVPK